MGYRVQAAVGFVKQVFFLVIFVANTISIGTVALVLRATGGGDPRTGMNANSQSLIFGVAVAAGLSSTARCLQLACGGPYSGDRLAYQAR
jgi:Na+-driven multidrug efflux pump